VAAIAVDLIAARLIRIETADPNVVRAPVARR